MATRKAAKTVVKVQAVAKKVTKAGTVTKPTRGAAKTDKAAARDKDRALKAKKTLARNKAIRSAAVSAIRVLSGAHKGQPASRIVELANDSIGNHVDRHGAKHGFNGNHVDRAASMILKAANGTAPATSISRLAKNSLIRRASAIAALNWAKSNPVTS